MSATGDWERYSTAEVYSGGTSSSTSTPGDVAATSSSDEISDSRAAEVRLRRRASQNTVARDITKADEATTAPAIPPTFDRFLDEFDGASQRVLEMVEFEKENGGVGVSVFSSGIQESVGADATLDVPVLVLEYGTNGGCCTSEMMIDDLNEILSPDIPPLLWGGRTLKRL